MLCRSDQTASRLAWPTFSKIMGRIRQYLAYTTHDHAGCLRDGYPGWPFRRLYQEISGRMLVVLTALARSTRETPGVPSGGPGGRGPGRRRTRNVRPWRYTGDMRFSIAPDGPFSLAAAAGLGFGPNTGRPDTGPGSAADGMRLAFVTDDMAHHAGAASPRTRTGPSPPTSTPTETRGRLAAGAPCPVPRRPGRRVGWNRRARPHHRPRCRRSIRPCGPCCSTRRTRRPPGRSSAPGASRPGHGDQEPVVRGARPDVHDRGRAGARLPAPHRLLKAGSLRSVAPQRVEWLHAVARAALDGVLDPEPSPGCTRRTR